MHPSSSSSSFQDGLITAIVKVMNEANDGLFGIVVFAASGGLAGPAVLPAVGAMAPHER
jgi:hypothetical protein